ncbi:hypothetical protein QCA50_013149 [Cerrena zonata]|uniref:RRM domain-containing protein n=1 Tax=Cerrena zonata TaxID=2478898 RepID=A0AAW0FRV0_9APHY
MSKVVFVGNVPYNMGEEQLIDAFKSVDHETAQSAVRNLNGQDVGGRPLRIDLADSDPFLEGKTTVRGELIDSHETRAQWRERERKTDPNSFLRELPAGAFVITHPDQARALLVAHPQLGYALFQALLLNKIVDPAILQRMLNATTGASQASPNAPIAPTPTVPPIAQQQSHILPPTPTQPNYPHVPHAPQPAYGHQPNIPPMHVPTPPIPTHTPMYGAQQHMPPPQAPQNPYYRPPIPAQPAPVQHQQPVAPVAAPVQAQAPPPVDPAAKEMILQVLRLTPDQVNQLPPNEREQLIQLRKTYAHLLNGA